MIVRKRKFNDKSIKEIDFDLSKSKHCEFIKSNQFKSLLLQKLHPNQIDLSHTSDSSIKLMADSSDILNAAEEELLNVAQTGYFKRFALPATDKCIVPLGFDPHPSHTAFIRNKILGPQGSFLKHIQSTTSTRVQLQGKGSGFFEPIPKEIADQMYVKIEGEELEKVEEARQLCQDLITTVRTEYQAALYNQMQMYQYQQYYAQNKF